MKRVSNGESYGKAAKVSRPSDPYIPEKGGAVVRDVPDGLWERFGAGGHNRVVVNPVVAFQPEKIIDWRRASDTVSVGRECVVCLLIASPAPSASRVLIAEFEESGEVFNHQELRKQGYVSQGICGLQAEGILQGREVPGPVGVGRSRTGLWRIWENQADV
jgi:hypothetical protein